MKLQIDLEKNAVTSVAEQTKVTDVIASATQVFLGTAIGLGFVASAMGFFLMPKTVLKSGPPKVAYVALTASDVTSAKSIMDGTSFVPLKYKINTTTVYTQNSQEGNPDTNPGVKTGNVSIQLDSLASTGQPQWLSWLGVNEVSAQATSFSIEPISLLPAQLIQLSYRRVTDTTDQILTVCLGPNSVSRVYIGLDGSTYTDSGLTRRTTTQPCATIVQRALKVGDVSNLEFAQDELVPVSEQNEFLVHRTGVLLGRAPQTGDYEENAQSRENFGDPLLITYRGSAPSGNDEDPFNIPDTIVSVKDYSVLINDLDPTVYPLCFPGVEFPHGNTGQAYYFDLNGRAYYDIMLNRPASNVDCAAVNQQALLMSSFNESRLLLDHDGNLTEQEGWYVKNGRFVARTIFANHGNGTPQEGQNIGDGRWPLALRPFVADPQPEHISSVPSALMYFMGEYYASGSGSYPVNVLLCYPATNVQLNNPTDQGQVAYYYDKQGNPYRDLFLTDPVSDANCKNLQAKTLQLSSLTKAEPISLNGTFPSIAVLRFSHLSGLNAAYRTAGFSQGPPAEVAPVGDPLTVFAQNNATTPGSFTIPAGTWRLTGKDKTGTVVTKMVCIPALTYSNPTASVPPYPTVYLRQDGQPFSDIFLQKPVSCTSGGGGGGGIEPIETQ